MAGKDEKDLHTNQLPDSELNGAVGGASKHYKTQCTTCGYESFHTYIFENALAWKNEHLQSNPGHNCWIITYN